MATTAVVAGLAIASAAAGAGTQIHAARQQNKAIAKSMASRQETGKVQQRQLVERAAVERRNLQQQAAQLRGRLRVASAESGIGGAGSFAALQRAVDFQEDTARHIQDINLRGQLDAVRAGQRADFTQLSAGVQSPTLGGITGGLSGLSTGLSIGGAFQSVSAASRSQSDPGVRT